MSIEILAISVSHAETWRVNWRDARGYLRWRWAPSKSAARAMDEEIKLGQERGELEARGDRTVAGFLADLWSAREMQFFPRTKHYRPSIDEFIVPQLGELRLADLTPARINEFLLQWRDDTKGVADMRAALSVMLEQAVKWQRLRVNPMLLDRTDVVERMRNWMLGVGQLPDAVLVTALAYAGLAFEEAVTLEWSRVREDELVSPLAVDVRRLRSQSPCSETHLFSSLVEQHGDWERWQRVVFRPAAELAGATGLEPSDLRHMFEFVNRDSPEAAAERVLWARERMVNGNGAAPVP